MYLLHILITTYTHINYYYILLHCAFPQLYKMIEDRYLIATLICRSIKSFVILLQHPASASTLALRYANA